MAFASIRSRSALGAVLLLVVIAAAVQSPPSARAWTSDIDGVTHGVSSGTVSADIGRSIAIGEDGSLYLAGFMSSDTVTIGSVAANLIGDVDAFIARLTPAGDPVWFTSIGASGEDTYFFDVEILGDAILVAGTFTGTVTIGSDTISSAGGYDGFVAAFDDDGNGLWATRMGGGADDDVSDIVVTTEGTIAAVGTAHGDVTVGSSNSTSPWNDTTHPDGIVFILDTNGDVAANSASRIGSSGDDELRNVAQDQTGNVIVTGFVGPSATTPTSDPNEVSATFGSSDAIVASVDSSGDIVWSQVIGGSGADVGEGVVVDSVGRITVAAHGRAPFTVDGDSYSGGDSSRNDIILSQFNADGNARWTTVVDGGTNANDDGVRHLALGPEDELVTAGLLTPPGASKYRFMTMVHDADGNLIWGPVTLGDDANRHIAQSVAVTTTGDLLLTGRFQGGPVDPDDPSVILSTSSNTSDIVLIRLAEVVQTDQTITFETIDDRSYSSTPFDVSATTDADGLTVVIASSTTDVCTVTDTTVTMLAAGTCTLTASQSGERHYRPATDVTRSFIITPASQTITFAAIDDQMYSSTPFGISATSDAEGLTVTIESTTTDSCTVSDATVTMLAAGTCTLTARQSGDDRYAAAEDVTMSFSITSAPQTIALDPIGDRNLAEGEFEINPTTDADDLTVTITSSTTDICTVADGTVTVLAAGTCTLTASQTGDNRYAAAEDVTRSFSVVVPEVEDTTSTSPSTTATPDTTTTTTEATIATTTSSITTSPPATTTTTASPTTEIVLPATGHSDGIPILPLVAVALGAALAFVVRRRTV